MIKIVKGKKIPPASTHRNTKGRTRLYPFGDMKKGDSFAVESQTASAVYQSLKNWNELNRSKVKLISRRLGAKTWFWKS
jgi:hypothetical protein